MNPGRAGVLRVLTSSDSGAIGVLQFDAPNEASLRSVAADAGVPVPTVGGVVVGSIAGIDRGVVVRWSPTMLHMMPHAGPAVVRAIADRLSTIGVLIVGPNTCDPRLLYPEAADEVEARMLDALAEAASPLAIDLLLDQPRRWRKPSARSDPDLDRLRSRLITPPLVVAVGPPNIGKSSLCNALAGRAVALVADLPGTTRDHVGVSVDLAGLVARYVDAPGMHAHGARPGAPAEEAAAVEITRRVIAAADLVLSCGDPLTPPIVIGGSPEVVTIALRTDLGRPQWPHDVAVSVRDGLGLDSLVHRIRDRLVPEPALTDLGPWRFWGAEGSGDR